MGQGGVDQWRESQLSFVSYDCPSVQEGVMGSYCLSSAEFFVCTLLVHPAHHERDGHMGIVWGAAGLGEAQQDEIQVPVKGEDEDEDDGKGYERMQDH